MTDLALSASGGAMDEPVEAAVTRHAELFWVLSALLWVPQAWLVASQIAGLLDGGALAISYLPVAGFTALGLLRICLDARAQRVLTETARAYVLGLRQRILAREGRRSPFDPARPNSAALAALVTQKLDMLVPYLTRFSVFRSQHFRPYSTPCGSRCAKTASLRKPTPQDHLRPEAPRWGGTTSRE